VIIAKFAAVVLVGYLLGSIPFGVIVSKWYAGVDVTRYGSGKMGATNVMRVAGKKAAALAVILDLLKGVAAVTFAGFLFGHEYLLVGESSLWLARSGQVAAALCAMAGHKWSVFLKFHGGRGVAPFFGGLLALCPLAALFGGEVLIIGASLTRYASLGSITGAVGSYTILVPLTIVNGYPVEYLIYALIGAIFIIVVHRDNISRLLAGTERRLGERVEISRSAVPPRP
jgi:glycerol-3-phosphate acyltransferase PlsY